MLVKRLKLLGPNVTGKGESRLAMRSLLMLRRCVYWSYSGDPPIVKDAVHGGTSVKMPLAKVKFFWNTFCLFVANFLLQF